jgi:hypothetical protein
MRSSSERSVNDVEADDDMTSPSFRFLRTGIKLAIIVECSNVSAIELYVACQIRFQKPERRSEDEIQSFLEFTALFRKAYFLCTYTLTTAKAHARREV